MRNSSTPLTLVLLATMSLSAVAAISYSPITCGCVDPWRDLAIFLGHPDMRSPTGLTADLVQKELSRQLSKKKLSLRDLPLVGGGNEDCANTLADPPSIHCRWWIWEHRDSSNEVEALKGFQVRIDLARDRTFQRVDVAEVEYIRRYELP